MNKPKFRAWKKIRIQEMFDEVVAIDWLNNKIKIKYPNPGGNTFRIDEESLDNVILMQYTGLKDKNGVEIFGKDFVEGFYGGTYVKGVIQFIDGCHCLQRIGDFHAICLFEVDNRNILGSIHANPELLNEVE
ncbi:YopX family protein [Enterococcus sp. AZ177]|uniref:YopX family protein n=1 Tax=unclassified Enterococcus TaxID=2608891 RepID=UPI003D2FD07E